MVKVAAYKGTDDVHGKPCLRSTVWTKKRHQPLKELQVQREPDAPWLLGQAGVQTLFGDRLSRLCTFACSSVLVQRPMLLLCALSYHGDRSLSVDRYFFNVQFDDRSLPVDRYLVYPIRRPVLVCRPVSLLLLLSHLGDRYLSVDRYFWPVFNRLADDRCHWSVHINTSRCVK